MIRVSVHHLCMFKYKVKGMKVELHPIMSMFHLSTTPPSHVGSEPYVRDRMSLYDTQPYLQDRMSICSKSELLGGQFKI
jgi:hypothetical protein